MAPARWIACVFASLLLAAAAPASALPAGAGVSGPCATLGNPPDDPPRASLDHCGPKIVVRVLTPAAGLVAQIAFGCEEACALVVHVDVLLCEDWTRRHIGPTPQPIDARTSESLSDLVDEAIRHAQRVAKTPAFVDADVHGPCA